MLQLTSNLKTVELFQASPLSNPVSLSHPASRLNQFSLAYSAYQSDTSVVIPVYRIGDARALVALRVFLRLTAMDVCCGPPTLR